MPRTLPRSKRFFKQALTRLDGRLDILFHVAGISGRRFGDAALHECTVEGWDTVLNANARSTFSDQSGSSTNYAHATTR